MKILKKRFRKKKKTPPGGDKLKHPMQEGIVIKPKSLFSKKLVKIKPKQGRWCEYYEGRLPYPMECSHNKSMPLSQIFKGNEVHTISDRSNCVNCKRAPQWHSWKRGDWTKIIKAIVEDKEDLTDMDPPNQEMR